jgi:hypothetical protein
MAVVGVCVTVLLGVTVSVEVTVSVGVGVLEARMGSTRGTFVEVAVVSGLLLIHPGVPVASQTLKTINPVKLTPPPAIQTGLDRRTRLAFPE